MRRLERTEMPHPILSPQFQGTLIMNNATHEHPLATSSANNPPHASLGAGQLASMLWKSNEGGAEGNYQFNLFRLLSTTGHVSQLFRPEDIPSLLKLLHLLATTLIAEGVLDTILSDELSRIAQFLHEAFDDSAERSSDAMNADQRNALADVLAYLQNHLFLRTFDFPPTNRLHAQIAILQQWLASNPSQASKRQGDKL